MRVSHCSTILIALGACSYAQPPRNDLGASLRACADRKAAADAFSGSILTAENGRVTWQASYGHADAERRIPNTLETRFNVASAGKMFTSVAIGQLVDSGRLRFSDPIARHLPGLTPEVGAITIHQLLTHTSGLGDYLRPENRDAIRAARTAADLLPVALADGVVFEPGTRQSYSNSGYVVLGAIIERLSGLSYREYLQRHIFGPAGMSRTSLDGDTPRATPMTRRRPGGEPADGRPRPAPLIGSAHGSPAGGAVSTVGDLFRFMEALRTHRLVRAETTELMWQPHHVSKQSDSGTGRTSYGYGFNRADVGGSRFVGHGGGMLGANAQIEMQPETGRLTIALSNYDPPVATELVQAARQAFIGADPATICASKATAGGRS